MPENNLKEGIVPEEKEETTKEYIDRYRERYKTLRPVYCHALKDTVYFNSEGFNHLLFKEGHRRPDRIIKNRLPLINLIIPVLTRCKSVSKTLVLDEIYNGQKQTAMYFELSFLVGKKCPTQIKVVVKKRGKLGKLLFLSVMKQKTPKKGR